MENDLKRLVVEEFSGANAQKAYLKKAKDGLWVPESHFIRKYFMKKGAVLDIAAGLAGQLFRFQSLASRLLE